MGRSDDQRALLQDTRWSVCFTNVLSDHQKCLIWGVTFQGRRGRKHQSCVNVSSGQGGREQSGTGPPARPRPHRHSNRGHEPATRTALRKLVLENFTSSTFCFLNTANDHFIGDIHPLAYGLAQLHPQLPASPERAGP